MKLKSVLTITTLLLLSILGAGAASAYVGYRMGTLALKGVSQPEDNPTRKLARQAGYRKPQPFEPVSEKTILVKVYNQKYHYNKTTKTGKSGTTATETNKEKPKSTAKATFPLKETDRDMTLEVSQVKREGEDIILTIGLTNQGTDAVKFLYSFLEVTDNEGDALGVIVEDLPETIPANSKKIEGIVRIPTTLTEETTALSLSLSDYPKQTRTLKIPNIPLNDIEASTPETSETPELEESPN
ncbi:MAG: hypothetical protein AB4041_16955 [Microcystaceae cyanobacterium]